MPTTGKSKGAKPPTRFYKLLRQHIHDLAKHDSLGFSERQRAARLEVSRSMYSRLLRFWRAHLPVIDTAEKTGDWRPVEEILFSGWGDYAKLPSFTRVVQGQGAHASETQVVKNRRRISAMMRTVPWIGNRADYERISAIVQKACIINEGSFNREQANRFDYLSSLIAAYEAAESPLSRRPASSELSRRDSDRYTRSWKLLKIRSHGVEKESLEEEGGCLTDRDFAKALRVSVAELLKREKAHSCFSIRWRGRRYWPRWQLGLPGIPDVLAILVARGASGSSISEFFLTPTDALFFSAEDGEDIRKSDSPLSLLRRCGVAGVKRAVQHAERWGEHGAL